MIETTAHNPATPTAPTDRDQQRSTLDALLDLCRTCAAREIEIEQTRQAAIAVASREFDRATTHIESGEKSRRGLLQKSHDDRVAELESTAEGELGSLNTAYETTRRRIEHQKDSVSQDIKQQLQQATWLADSVLEAAQIQIRQEHKKTKEQIAAQQELLDAMEKESIELLAVYGQTQLAGAEVAVEPVGDNPDADFSARLDVAKANLVRLKTLRVPRLFVGMTPYLLGLGICVVAAVVAQWSVGSIPSRIDEIQPQWKPIGIALAIAIGVIAIAAVGLRLLGRAHVRDVYTPLRRGLEGARVAAQAQLAQARKNHDARHARALKKREAEVHAVRDKLSPVHAKSSSEAKAALD
ncbi:MAG: hypothetical protein ACREJC_20500, partial [Tepidisphaeraceae bacterium]